MKVIIAYDGSTYAAAAIDDMPRAGIPPGSEVPVVSVADFSAARPEVSEFNLISATSRRVDTILPQVKHHQAQVLKETRNMTSKVVRRLRLEFPAWDVVGDGEEIQFSEIGRSFIGGIRAVRQSKPLVAVGILKG